MQLQMPCTLKQFGRMKTFWFGPIRFGHGSKGKIKSVAKRHFLVQFEQIQYNFDGSKLKTNLDQPKIVLDL